MSPSAPVQLTDVFLLLFIIYDSGAVWQSYSFNPHGISLHFLS